MSVEVELSQEHAISSQLLSAVVREHVTAQIPSTASFRASQRGSYNAQRPPANLNDGKLRSTLQLSLKLWECRRLEAFTEEFLNETELLL